MRGKGKCGGTRKLDGSGRGRGKLTMPMASRGTSRKLSDVGGKK